MKQKFLDLYKKLKKKPVNSISGINAKLPNFSPEAMTLLLYPTLEDSADHLKIQNVEFDVNLLRELFEIKEEYLSRHFTRVFLFGENIKPAFETIAKAGYVYEDVFNPVIITAEEIQLTFKGNLKLVKNIIENYQIFALYVNQSTIDCYLGQLSSLDVDLSKAKKRRYYEAFNTSVDSPFLFITLLKHKGLIHHELAFIEALRHVSDKHHEKFFANANSKFIRTYLQLWQTINPQSWKGLTYEIDLLLDNYEISLFADDSYKNVVNKYYDLINMFNKTKH